MRTAPLGVITPSQVPLPDSAMPWAQPSSKARLEARSHQRTPPERSWTATTLPPTATSRAPKVSCPPSKTGVPSRTLSTLTGPRSGTATR